MNRRSFLKSLGKVAALSICLPTTILSYDPIKREIVKPKIDNTIVNGYRGSQYMECGYIYAPYLPLIQTCNL